MASLWQKIYPSVEASLLWVSEHRFATAALVSVSTGVVIYALGCLRSSVPEQNSHNTDAPTLQSLAD